MNGQTMDSKQQRILARQQQHEQRATQDVACVIHGNLYPWEYVERLYHMVRINLSCPVRFHVFTEHDRPVPATMIKHILDDWPGIAGKKKAWWYKMQMFDGVHVQGRLLYFDLDTVIARPIDWMLALPAEYFWTIRDFRYLWRPNWRGLNSSIMIWDTVRFRWIWQQFREHNIAAVTRQFHGDQDFLNYVLCSKHLRFMPEHLIKSWRWQIKDGGMDMRNRVYRRPDAGSVLDPDTAVMIFHGSPKPHEVQDSLIQRLWMASPT
jgi:hypothetical protein